MNNNFKVIDNACSLDIIKGGRDSRIQLNKIQDYIEVLNQYGTTAGEPYMKHLDGDIWELRPVKNRILFAACLGNSFVLLHPFFKKTKKPQNVKLKKQKEN